MHGAASTLAFVSRFACAVLVSRIIVKAHTVPNRYDFFMMFTKLVVVLGIVTARIILAPVLHDIAGLVAAID